MIPFRAHSSMLRRRRRAESTDQSKWAGKKTTTVATTTKIRWDSKRLFKNRQALVWNRIICYSEKVCKYAAGICLLQCRRHPIFLFLPRATYKYKYTISFSRLNALDCSSEGRGQSGRRRGGRQRSHADFVLAAYSIFSHTVSSLPERHLVCEIWWSDGWATRVCGCGMTIPS